MITPPHSAAKRRDYRAAMPVLIALCVYAVMFSSAAQEDTVVRIGGGDDRTTVLRHASWLFDPSAALSFDDVASLHEAGDFRVGDKPDFQLWPRRASAWLHLELINDAQFDRFVLEVTNARMPEVDFYFEQEDGSYKHCIAGTARPYYDRDVVFLRSSAEIDLPAGEPRSVFVHVSNNGDLRFDLVLWRAHAFFDYAMHAVVFNILMTGLLLAMVAFNFVVFLSMRESNYLYLTLFLSSWLLWYLAYTATGSVLLWSDAPVLATRAPTIFNFLNCATFAIFVHSMLEMPKYAPKWSRLILVYAIVCVGGIIFSLVTDNLYRVHLSLLLAAMGPFILAGVSIRMFNRTESRVRLFMLTWVAGHLFGISAIIALSYFQTQESFGAHWINAIVVASALMWSFELTGRVKHREREQRRILEDTVTERTKELTDALQDVNQLSGMLPICSSCKKIRDDTGYWSSVEAYIAERTDAMFTHGVCPECRERLYPKL